MKKISPGVSRKSRISDEGLQRLEKQLLSGCKMTQQVKDQWILRYGEAARELFARFDCR
jgi:hypothetical protein